MNRRCGDEILKFSQLWTNKLNEMFSYQSQTRNIFQCSYHKLPSGHRNNVIYMAQIYTSRCVSLSNRIVNQSFAEAGQWYVYKL